MFRTDSTGNNVAPSKPEPLPDGPEQNDLGNESSPQLRSDRSLCRSHSERSNGGHSDIHSEQIESKKFK